MVQKYESEKFAAFWVTLLSNKEKLKIYALANGLTFPILQSEEGSWPNDVLGPGHLEVGRAILLAPGMEIAQTVIRLDPTDHAELEAAIDSVLP